MTSRVQEPIRTQIRWLVRRDMPEVLTIEAESFEFPWLEEDFSHCLQQRNCIGMVADYDHHVVGYMVYELASDHIHLLNLAVAPSYRRRGIGTQLVKKLINKLAVQNRRYISLEVRETNLAAQLFFRANGFRAVEILRNFYEDSTEDAYVMRYVRPEPAAVKTLPRNRLRYLIR